MYWLLKKCKSPCRFQCVLAYSFWALLFAWSRFKQSSYSCIWCQRVRELSHGFNETLQNITKDVTNWNIDVHCTLVWMFPRNNKNLKNSVPKETKFCCFKFTSHCVHLQICGDFHYFILQMNILYVWLSSCNNLHAGMDVETTSTWNVWRFGQNINVPLVRTSLSVHSAGSTLDHFRFVSQEKELFAPLMICNWMISLHHTFSSGTYAKQWTSSPWTTPVDLLHGPFEDQVQGLPMRTTPNFWRWILLEV